MDDSESRMTSPQLTRRRFLQGSTVAGFSAFLAACGGGLGSPSPSAQSASAQPSASGPTPEPTPAASPGGALVVANWPAYIDLAGTAGDEGVYAPGSSPTLEEFQKKFGITVDYQEKIEDNAEFFTTIEQQLVAGLPTGWDLIVVTDWLAGQIIAKGWAEEIDQANVPTAEKNLRDQLRGQVWDPEQTYHYPWQSGMAGIGYNTATLTAAGAKEPKSVADLFALPPDKISFLTEVRDTFALTLLKLGITPDPTKITEDDLQKVHDEIKPLADKGLRFLDNAYLKEFASKSVWAAMVWSGDLASSGTEGDTFVFPEEGSVVFTDNMIIPKGAANKRNAEAFIDYYYDVDVATAAAAYIYYVSPVEGVREKIAEVDEAAATDPYLSNLLFPSEELQAKQVIFQDLPEALEQKMNELYLDLSGA
jgi:spermidine/putrescine transport system substrate-binding protein